MVAGPVAWGCGAAGGIGADGVAADALREMKPWRRETLEYIVKWKLNTFNLRGELHVLEGSAPDTNGAAGLAPSRQ
jgi:hypothetical protein